MSTNAKPRSYSERVIEIQDHFEQTEEINGNRTLLVSSDKSTQRRLEVRGISVGASAGLLVEDVSTGLHFVVRLQARDGRLLVNFESEDGRLENSASFWGVQWRHGEGDSHASLWLVAVKP